MKSDIIVQNRTTLAADAIPPGISAKQALALGSLLSGKPISQAARDAGVSRSTLHKWLSEDPEFICFFNSLKRELAETVEQNLRLLASKAVRTLSRLLTRRSVSDAIKLQAATVVLKLASGPVRGPITPEDARNEILLAAKQRQRDSMLATLGMRDKGDLLARLGRCDLDEAADAADTGIDETEYEEDDEIDEDELDDDELDDDLDIDED